MFVVQPPILGRACGGRMMMAQAGDSGGTPLAIGGCETGLGAGTAEISIAVLGVSCG